MNNLLADCRGFADVYIDDIVIYSRTLDEHLTHLRAVLLHLRAEKLFAKLKQALADSTLLAHPDMSQPFTLHIDASADALGATLSQPDRRGMSAC